MPGASARQLLLGRPDRQPSPAGQRGYNESEIARKTDLDPKYVRGLLRLLEHGEERLINAVEKGRIPITVAAEIAGTDDDGAQSVLREAYEKNRRTSCAVKS